MSTSIDPLLTAMDTTSDTSSTADSSSSDSSSSISDNEFLDLMMDELTHQDPTDSDSSDPTEYLTQLAEITSVEQEEQINDSSQLESAMSLIGDTVTYTDPDTGDSVTGEVESVQVSDDTPTLTVGSDSGVSLSSITNVEASS